MKNAEDILEEKELDYLRGFLDCATLLNGESQSVPHDVEDGRKGKPFAVLSSRIQTLYSISAEAYDEKLKAKLGIIWPTEKEELQKTDISGGPRDEQRRRTEG
jgi:hypothetical protein